MYPSREGTRYPLAAPQGRAAKATRLSSQHPQGVREREGKYAPGPRLDWPPTKRHPLRVSLCYGGIAMLKNCQPASPRHRRTIANLCRALRISEPLEELPMTSGQAWQTIQDLAAQVKRDRTLAASGPHERR